MAKMPLGEIVDVAAVSPGPSNVKEEHVQSLHESVSKTDFR